MAMSPLWLRNEQLLGEIETRIVGMRHHDAQVDPGEQVNLEGRSRAPPGVTRNSRGKTAASSRSGTSPAAFPPG